MNPSSFNVSTPPMSPTTVHPLQIGKEEAKELDLELRRLKDVRSSPCTPSCQNRTPASNTVSHRSLQSSDGPQTRVIVHCVSKNDTLQGLALHYGIEVSALRAANHLWSHDSIYSSGNQHMYIPVDQCSRLNIGEDVTSHAAAPMRKSSGKSRSKTVGDERPPRSRQRQYGAITEAGTAFYNLKDSRERMIAPPFEVEEGCASDSARASSSETRRDLDLSLLSDAASFSSSVNPEVDEEHSLRESVEDLRELNSPTLSTVSCDRMTSEGSIIERMVISLDTVDSNRLSFFPSHSAPSTPKTATFSSPSCMSPAPTSATSIDATQDGKGTDPSWMPSKPAPTHHHSAVKRPHSFAAHRTALNADLSPSFSPLTPPSPSASLPSRLNVRSPRPGSAETSPYLHTFPTPRRNSSTLQNGNLISEIISATVNTPINRRRSKPDLKVAGLDTIELRS